METILKSAFGKVAEHNKAFVFGVIPKLTKLKELLYINNPCDLELVTQPS